MKKTYDVIILGAGAAGLACASELLKDSKNILLLEARDRVGGRAHTLYASTGEPIEMGPEFIHGNPPETMRWVDELAIPFYDVTDGHIYFDEKQTRTTENFWDLLSQQMQQLLKSKKDESVAQFLASRKGLSKRSRELFRAYVEGFHAADLDLIGRHGLGMAEEVVEEDDLNGSELFRLTHGYRDFFQKLLYAVPGLLDCLKLNTLVKQIHWQGRELRVDCLSTVSSEKIQYAGRKLVVALPLGVLKAEAQQKGGIAWQPQPPPGLSECLAGLEMGPIEKLNFTFRSRFWEGLIPDEKPAFFHGSFTNFFPTWWTMLPLRNTQLVAWQGGPKAQEMANWSQEQKVEVALKTLSRLSKKSISFLANEMQSCESHNWTTDPFSLGAYSYIKVGGVPGAEKMQQVFADKIVFAGEATAEGPARGTVHGALASGLRAARQIRGRARSRN